MDIKKIKRIFFEEFWSLYQLLFMWIPGRLGHYIRGAMLGVWFRKKGRKLQIKENVEIWHPQKLSIGHNCSIGRNNIINCVGNVIIENNVRMGPNIMITTINHATVKSGMENKKKEIKPVHIHNNVWVGNGVTILPGVFIGKNSIVAAGAVVTKSFPEQSIIAGIPARRI